MDTFQEIFEKYKYYIFSILVLLLLSNTFKTLAASNYSEQQITKFETVTVDTLDMDAIFRIGSIINTYDEKGQLSYTVTFKIDGFSQKIECNIPQNMLDVLDKEAIYTGKVKLGYFKEVYEFIIEQDGSEFDTIEEAARGNAAARGIVGVDFMFSDYIKTELDTPETLKSNYIELYCPGIADDNKSSENNKDE